MTTTTIRPANFTRRTHDLAAKLRGERRYGWLALYHLLRLSDLGREGIERSGSYRFADHLYANRASGRGFIGRVLDRVLLSLPAARAMRRRYVESTAAMRRALESHLEKGRGEPFRVLTVPCGIPRDVREFSETLLRERPSALATIEFTGMDLAPEVLAAARDFQVDYTLSSPRWVQGDALDPEAYPGEAPFHFVASTGLGEFLDDAQLVRLYSNIYGRLAPGGVFFTSATAHEPRSDAMLRAFELNTHYRTRADLERLLASCPWQEVRFTHDRTGLQTFVWAVKGRG